MKPCATVNIAASVEGKSGSAQLTVTVPPVATITLTPPSGFLVAGTSGQVVATLQDASGTVLTGRAISWASSKQKLHGLRSSKLSLGAC